MWVRSRRSARAAGRIFRGHGRRAAYRPEHDRSYGFPPHPRRGRKRTGAPKARQQPMRPPGLAAYRIPTGAADTSPHGRRLTRRPNMPAERSGSGSPGPSSEITSRKAPNQFPSWSRRAGCMPPPSRNRADGCPPAPERAQGRPEPDICTVPPANPTALPGAGATTGAGTTHPGRVPSGRPRTVGDDRVAYVIERTLHTTPPDATHWSTRPMAGQGGLAQTTVRRIRNAFGLQPHRSETFRPSGDPAPPNRADGLPEGPGTTASGPPERRHSIHKMLCAGRAPDSAGRRSHYAADGRAVAYPSVPRLGACAVER